VERLITAIRNAARLTRDWRVRVLVPVVLINVAAFAGLYTLMYRYALSNLVSTHKFGVMLLLDQLELDLREFALLHDRDALQESLRQHADVRKLLAIHVYDGNGTPIASTKEAPAEREAAQARVVLMTPQHPAMWLTEGDTGSNIFGVRALQKHASCTSCHVTNAAVLGAIQIGIDMTGAMATAKTRVRRNFAMAGAAWLALLALMFWTGGIVIGRPLAQMEHSMQAAGIEADRARRHDLDALALRIHDSLWGLIRAQRQREEDIARHMVRAEQLASLGQMAAGLTHEIKNPLAGVSAALELLRDENDESDPAREIYDQMLAELRRVTGTVESLLRLGKPQPPQRAEVDLGRVAREVTSLFGARLRRQGVTLETEIADSVPPLQLDAGLMVQLLMNLLTNAMQASDRGGTIKVLIAPFPRRDGVVMAVSDSGRGIAPEDLERIFDPFFTTKEEGTGLGLPICRQIVEQHGGTMQIESERGRGTRVMVVLPDLAAAADADEDADEDAHQERMSHGAVAAG
jgi:signal transduction histidine kinase